MYYFHLAVTTWTVHGRVTLVPAPYSAAGPANDAIYRRRRRGHARVPLYGHRQQRATTLAPSSVVIIRAPPSALPALNRNDRHGQLLSWACTAPVVTRRSRRSPETPADRPTTDRPRVENLRQLASFSRSSGCVHVYTVGAITSLDTWERVPSNVWRTWVPSVNRPTFVTVFFVRLDA